MALKPDASIMVALATGTLVYGIYQTHVPTTADVRTVEQMNTDIESAERQAAWTSATVVSGISLVSKDPNPLILGGVMIIILSWTKRHANMVNPLTGKATGDGLDMSDLRDETTQEESPEEYGYADDMAVA